VQNTQYYKDYWSHFISSGLKYCVFTSKIKNNVLNVFMLYCKSHCCYWGV